MANHASALKRVRRNKRKAFYNKARTSQIRTYLKKVEEAVESKDKKKAQAALQEAQPKLYRGVSKGILKKNTVARTMSRLSARIKALG